MKRRCVPGRSDIVWVSLSPQSGHEQTGRRPALVLSPAAYNGKVGLAIVCPITSVAKGYPFEVTLPEGMKVGGVVLADAVRSLDWIARRAEFVCAAPEAVLVDVMGRLGTLLDVRATA